MKKGTIDKAVIFFCIPIVGTVLSYLYEASYGDYFGIPRELISIDLFHSLLIPTAFIVLTVIFYFSSKFILMLIPYRSLRFILFSIVAVFAFNIIFKISLPMIIIAWVLCISIDLIIAIDTTNQDKDGLDEFMRSLFFKNIKPQKSGLIIMFIGIFFTMIYVYQEFGSFDASKKR